MATRTGSGKWTARSVHKWSVSGLLNGDVSNTLNAPNLPDKTVSVSGVFGVGGSLSLEGDNVDGTGGVILKDTSGANLTFTAAGVAAIAPDAEFIRAHVTAGDGTTNLRVDIISTKAK